MKYALVLEKNTQACNNTSIVLASMGYLITPVFNPIKALHAAHMIQFDLIVTYTTAIPGDRRSLTGELARCSPDAILILLLDADAGPADANVDGVSAIFYRPLSADKVIALVESEPNGFRMSPPPERLARERRRRAV